MVGTNVDITERKRMEERLRQQEEELRRHRDHLEDLVQEATRKLEHQQVQLIQSEKMASLGQMAAGIAHEINNPMSYISSNLNTLCDYTQVLLGLQQLYQELEEAVVAGVLQRVEQVRERIQALRRQEAVDSIVSDMQEVLEDSLEGTRRVDEIIQGLKMFARPDSGPPQLADVNKLLESTLKLVRNQLKYKCEVLCHFGSLPPLPCHSTQISQVFTNLLVNAAQAIEEWGEIHITSRQEGAEAVVEISDTGAGMTPETLARLFTPFFTTKPPGKGTGLGLSICYSIINRHQGRIEVRSEPGKGSTFTIRLPVAPEPQGSA
jgi:signal transduction histidine kinase